MSLDLLDTPIRISWDLAGDRPGLDRDQAATVARRLAEAGVFFAWLDGRPLLHPALGTILEILAGSGCRALAVSQGSAEELAALVANLPLAGLFVDLTPAVSGDEVDSSRVAATVAAVREGGWEPAALFRPRAGNLGALPELLQVCGNLGIGKIKLPNTGADDSFSASLGGALPGPDDLRLLADRLARRQPGRRGDGPVLEIHDLFLWELLVAAGEGERSEYGGCQAGNSLGHVDRDAFLLPCSSWPVRLGSLLERSVADLWATPERFAVRREIDQVPEGCRGCRDYALCLGGCRGLARTFNRHRGNRDPYCSAPRGGSSQP